MPSSPSGVVLPCRREPVEAVFLDEAGEPVASVLVRLRLSPTQVHDILTDEAGRARFEGLDPSGTYEFVFPELDKDAWKFVSDEALELSPALHDPLTWTLPSEAKPVPPSVIAKDGDCVTFLAAGFGFAPETVWNHGGNGPLREVRESMNILLENDEVFLPERRVQPQPCQTKRRYIMRLIGYPAMLRVRFLDDRFYPREGVPYLLILEAAGGSALPDREGETNGDGFLIEPIPPTALRGEIWLGKGEDGEVWPVEFGYVRPQHVTEGIQSRLSNLGYGFDPNDEEQFAEALRAFQWDCDIPVTGVADAATTAKLAAWHLS